VLATKKNTKQVFAKNDALSSINEIFATIDFVFLSYFEPKHVFIYHFAKTYDSIRFCILH